MWTHFLLSALEMSLMPTNQLIENKNWKLQFNAFIKDNFKRYTVRDLVYSAILLSLIIVGASVEKLIPSLPNGGGNIAKLNEFILLFGVVIFGFRIGMSANLIYLLIIAPIGSAFFLSGIFSIPGGDAIYRMIGVYFLDYFIPLSLITCIGLFYKSSTRTKIIAVTILLILNFLSHVTSGYVFFGSYAQYGIFGNTSGIVIVLYIWLYNLISYSLFYSFSIPVVLLSSRMQKYFLPQLEKKTY